MITFPKVLGLDEPTLGQDFMVISTTQFNPRFQLDSDSIADTNLLGRGSLQVPGAVGCDRPYGAPLAHHVDDAPRPGCGVDDAVACDALCKINPADVL